MRVIAALAGAMVLPASGIAIGQTPAPPAATAPSVQADTVDPNAIDALRRMSTYLSSLNSFELTSDASLEVVTDKDQKLQIGAKVHYKVKKPGIWIDFNSDLKDRQFFYDGKQFTIYSPKLNFYATTPAPATNREFLQSVYEHFGIKLPLADLFRWNDGDDSDIKAITSAFSVGTSNIDGVDTDHWAFRQGDYDWEIWIEKGDKPLPRQVSIIDRTAALRPGYSARLDWVVNPALSDQAFTYVPSANAKRIQLATFKEQQ